jgi:hypothetical protein
MNALVAKEHCCEEASTLSGQFYIPCNKPAINIVGWKGRSDKPIRMCDMCTYHNVNNRGGEIIQPYNKPWPNQTQWPIGSAESLEKATDVAIQNATAMPWPTASNPLDAMNEDQLLMLWQKKKDAIETAKAEEMDLRKYIVAREFPKKEEGTNNKELGNGYTLKAVVKYNYNLADNDTVEATLEKLSNLGNAGSAISDRLVSWTPSFKLLEYRELISEKEKGSKFASEALDIINIMLTIKEAAPTLEIKAPRSKK